MSREAIVQINDIKNTLIYAVYTAGTDLTQCSSGNVAVGVVVLNSFPDAAGEYECTFYGDGETFTPPDISTIYNIKFTPIVATIYNGTLTTDSTATSEDTATISGTGVVLEIVEIPTENMVDVFLNDSFSIEINESVYDIKSTNKFDTLVYTLLFTDARADIYSESKDKRGWVGDIDKEVFNSLIWTTDQSRLTRDNLNIIKSYAEKALQYMVQEKICDRVEVNIIESSNKNRSAKLEISIYTKSDILKVYAPIWEVTQ